MTTPWPSGIYGEEIPRRSWWLHAILVVVWGWNVVVGVGSEMAQSERWMVFPGSFCPLGAFLPRNVVPATITPHAPRAATPRTPPHFYMCYVVGLRVPS